jgi:hypothetical protein
MKFFITVISPPIIPQFNKVDWLYFFSNCSPDPAHHLDGGGSGGKDDEVGEVLAQVFR